MILKAVSVSTPPPDLTVSLTLTGGNLLEPGITLERKSENPSLPPPGSNSALDTTSQGSESNEEDKVSNSDKVESQAKNTDKCKSSDSAEPSQDSGAGSRADSDPAHLTNSLPVSHSAFSIQSETVFQQPKLKGTFLTHNVIYVVVLFWLRQ